MLPSVGEEIYTWNEEGLPLQGNSFFRLISLLSLPTGELVSAYSEGVILL